MYAVSDGPQSNLNQRRSMACLTRKSRNVRFLSCPLLHTGISNGLIPKSDCQIDTHAHTGICRGPGRFVAQAPFPADTVAQNGSSSSRGLCLCFDVPSSNNMTWFTSMPRYLDEEVVPVSCFIDSRQYSPAFYTDSEILVLSIGN